MPRVRAPPVASAAQPSPMKAPVKIPLNDDREEKAKRLQSRQAFHEARMDSLKAAATPPRKRKSLGREAPNTPDGVGAMEVGGTAVTPMKRVPILANFEEWMKMATDNKINATNSWNFALIDYFHDMSLLKEGDGVNFQKASCTLDGCVKIYTSRVDSVATETGKLLSGLADSGSKKGKGNTEDGEEGEEGEDDEDGEDGAKKRTKKKAPRSAEATLATSFAQLQLKKMELEFSVDPLFQKASADFDEGGAKGLLLNHLCIDNTGRIVFDSSDDAREELLEESRRDSMECKDDTEKEASSAPRERSELMIESTPIDIAGLGARFFPDLAILETQDICPSMKTFELGDGSGTLDLPFLKASDDWKKDKETQADDANDARSGIVLDDDDNALGFDDDIGGFDLPPETGFGEGGEVWAREANIATQSRPHQLGVGEEGEALSDGEVGGFDNSTKSYGVTLVHRPQNEQENILSYFDAALAKNWAGPEHWKIKRVKDLAKPTSATPTAKRKEKEPFEIDFLSPMTQSLADALYTPAPNNSSISLPKAQWRSKTRNLLPDDKHFNSRSLLTLFLKPKARIGARRRHSTTRTSANAVSGAGDAEPDENYWAHNGALAEPRPEDVPMPAGGDYDADFFADDALPMPGGGGAEDDDNDEFADAPETQLVPPIVDAAAAQPGGGSQEAQGWGAQLVTQSRRLRPEYVQYARVAKKVDVRRLKEEMWRGIGFEKSDNSVGQDTGVSKVALLKDDEKVTTAPDATLKFTDVVNGLQGVYPKQQMADISTSFCFICLLHLANEKGLVIENGEDFTELTIRRDHAAEITAGPD